MSKTKKRNPWAWIPTLYFAQGLPYVAVNVITVIMYKRLGISNTDIALYTAWLYLPWVIKPFWSPFVDLFKTKRWWTLTMQWIIGFGLAAVAFAIPTPFFFSLTLAVFWLIGFASATHDIASDGYYMITLSEHEQSLYVGIRSTFYRIATIVGQGLLVIIAGLIEANSGLEPVQIAVNADPSIAQEKTINLPSKIEISQEQANEQQFVLSSTSLSMSTKAPDSVCFEGNILAFADFKKKLVNTVSASNIYNGFCVDEASEEVVKTKKGLNGFEQWIKDTFGEERQEASVKNNNLMVVGVRLTQQPSKEDPIVLVLSYKSGDQSISLLDDKKLSTRFEFTSENWSKTAYFIVQADNKIFRLTTANFEGTSGNIPFAWMVVFLTLSVFFLLVAFYHSWALPRPLGDGAHLANEERNAKAIVREFLTTFKTFFQKKQVLVAMAFMLLYRLPESQMIKIINPFLLDPIDKGGLGLTTSQVGLVYGTMGIIGLTLGGILGGICAARGGLKKWLWPMALTISLNCLAYVFLSNVQPDGTTIAGQITIYICVFLEQFGYGFGFTAFMLYMMYFADGPFKTSHYAICTAFMALGMMLPGMMAGWLQELIGYKHFFYWILLCNLATWGVTALIKVDPNYGRKKTASETKE